jgi:peptidoglycan/LPS O-acetylase OafA/YrhL
MSTARTELSNSETAILRPQMPELDSVRGLAILLVLFYHCFYWGIQVGKFPPIERLFLTSMWTGRLGVNLFFVLSGFLITGLLVDNRSRRDYYRRFYIRRALRILPAYFATLTALAVAGTSWKFLGLSFVYLANLTPLFGVAIAYPVLWSLAVEEHFYLSWPMLVRKLTNRGILMTAAAVVAASPLLRLLTFYICARKGRVSYEVFDYTWNSADGLACGAALAVWLREFRPDRKKVAWVATGLLAAAISIELLGMPFGILTRQTRMGAALQVTPWHFAFTSALAAALLARGHWGEKMRFRFLEFFGEISYGLYLYHLIVLNAFGWLLSLGMMPWFQIDSFLGLSLRFLIVSGTSVGVAYLSRRQFEDRFLRLKERFT